MINFLSSKQNPESTIETLSLLLNWQVINPTIRLGNTVQQLIPKKKGTAFIMLNQKLIKYITEKEAVFWAGKHPPLTNLVTSQLIFDPTKDFREPAAHHGRFSAVYLVEYNLSKYKQWPLILDEALRLLKYGSTGLLFVRFSNSSHLNVFSFAAFLRRRRDFSFELIYQDADPNGSLLYAIQCTREENTPQLNDFEFAIITNGKRPEKVAEFIRSVAHIRGLENINWSIAICGPANIADSLDKLNGRLRFIEESTEHSDKGWITRKKNQIVATSKAENLLIAHDRYALPASFLEQIKEYGPDFAVVVPKQTDTSGSRFPDWVTVKEPWAFSPTSMLEYEDYDPNLYVNGGIIISKRRELTTTPWSELLFWNQAEDVELTRAFTEKGVTPRLARNVEVIVTDSRPDFTFAFARTALIAGETLKQGKVEINKNINLQKSNTSQLAEAGINAPPKTWFYCENGIKSINSSNELYLHILPHEISLCSLEIETIGVSDDSQLRITANNQPLLLNWSKTNDHQWLIKSSLETFSANTQTLALGFSGAKDLLIKELKIQRPMAQELSYPIQFTSKNLACYQFLAKGWSNLEAWGVWSDGPEAVLQLPIPSDYKKQDLRCLLWIRVYAPAHTQYQTIAVSCNQMPLTLLKVKAKSRPCKVVLHIPQELVSRASALELTFTPLFPCSPSELEGSSDNRKLGLALIKTNIKKV